MPSDATTGRTQRGLRITEIFHSIQGESTFAGMPCVFVRLTGCPLRCRWCDTAYAFSGGEWMSEEAILDQVRAFECPLVEVTGGEPLAQGGTVAFLRRLCDQGFTVLLETSGAMPIEEVDPRVRIILDLKCPDSGECERNRWENLSALKGTDEIKFVLASRGDYEWARATVISRRLDPSRVILSPVWEQVAPADLAAWVLADRLPVRMQVQLHKVIFGDRPGV
ncbi:MAG: 7-carboxy-7-deazaguanine synthase QueE [Candidatus Eisenbacteria bacterium]|nr:7-carboxy-7-deazaguanine synthase QueE [Candidatus Eisenbacteria bacterium]MCC7143632.1 7-carboxy-7-deazaguanine synthase QueE [Candidatus Eisenbacteria bacterium]